MMSKKMLADKFIKLHLEQYGLNGTNTQKNPPAQFPVFTAPLDFKIKNNEHVNFGYNGQVFNWRESSTCMFWVDYGKFENRAGNFVSEMDRSLKIIAKNSKTFSVPFFGSNFSQILCLLLAKTSQNYKICVPACTDFDALNFVEEFLALYNKSSTSYQKIEKIEFRKQEFETFLSDMTKQVRCADPIAAFSTFIGTRSAHPHIYQSPWPHIRDENFDTISGHAVGPSNWSVVDNESNFAVTRYLMKNRLDGIPNLFYSYPGILAALFNEPDWKSWLKESSSSLSRQANADKFISEKFLRTLFPEVRYSNSWAAANEYFENFKEELLAKYPKANEAWLTPLNRLIEKMGINYDFKFCQNEEIYGTVFSDQFGER